MNHKPTSMCSMTQFSQFSFKADELQKECGAAIWYDKLFDKEYQQLLSFTTFLRFLFMLTFMLKQQMSQFC